MRFLLINQTFYPDVASTAQHLTEFAIDLVNEGNEVTVITSQNAYDNGEIKYCKKEIYQGINIIRVKTTSFGKTAKWRRALDFASFIISCIFQLIICRKPECVVALTSPPLISFIAALYSKIRKIKFIYWIMDLNPDEAIAANWLVENSLLHRFLEMISIFSLRSAEKIIVLDRFMRDRIIKKGVVHEKISVIPPWPHASDVYFNQEGRKTFRQAYSLEDKFVVMYSGNHSPCHPLNTLLESAKLLKEYDEIIFMFIGGGSEHHKVKEFALINELHNIQCLPYQPIELLSSSLSAADLQVVAMGNNFVGTIHPCKIYNILTIGSPLIYIGPAESHITDILADLDDEYNFISVRHGEATKLKDLILKQFINSKSKELFSKSRILDDYKQIFLNKVLETTT